MLVETADVERAKALVAEALGLELEEDAVVADALKRRIQERRTTTARYFAELDARELRTLGELLTVGETYFFRMRGHYEVLRGLAVNAAGKSFAVLSAGCSTGEEAYSIAMTLRSVGAEKARVVGIDLNGQSLEKARAASYSEWALRAVAALDRDRWFVRDAKRWVVRPEIRTLVELRPGNLCEAGGVPLGPFDAVFCRNVIMYFTREAQRSAVASLTASLRSGGLLFLGHAETLRGLSTEYAVEQHGDVFHYRHRRTSSPPPPPVAPKRPPLPWIAPERSTPPATTPDVLALLAEERFADALRALPPEPSVVRAVALLGAGNVREAETTCASLISREEGGAEAHYVLGLAAESRSERAAAIDHYRAALYLEPDFSLALLQVGRLERREGKIEQARRDLRYAAELLGYERALIIALFGGGFDREGLIALARAELAAL